MVLVTMAVQPVAPVHGGQRPYYAGRAGRLHPCLGAEASSHGPNRLVDQRDSPFGRGQGARCPSCAGLLCRSTGAGYERSLDPTVAARGKIVAFLFMVINILVVAHRFFPMVQAVLQDQGSEIPQWLLKTVSMSLFPAFADEEVAALVVDNGGMAGFAGYDAPRAVPSTVACARLFPHIVLCSLCSSAGPRSSASWWVWSRRTVVRAQARGVSTGAVLGRVHVPGWWSPWWFHRCSSWTS